MIIDEEYRDLLRTLSEGSVHRRFDPYLDIDWDSPEYRVDPDDPRWVLPADCDPLGAHPWYRAQPLERRVAIGLWRSANIQKVGLQFESVLIRGMMQYAMRLPNGSPEFRYCLHEMTEECNHIQMFQELVNRSGQDVPGMKVGYRATSDYWHLAAHLPILFFIGILAGEEPIDHFQKDVIRGGLDRPPVLLRTMQIHIAEEARHISFAHRFLHEHVARQSRAGRAVTSLAFPLIMRWLAGAIMAPPRGMAKRFGIPRKVIREAFWKSPESRRMMRAYFGDVRMLARDLGLMNRPAALLWRLLRIDGEASRHRGEPHRTARPTVNPAA